MALLPQVSANSCKAISPVSRLGAFDNIFVEQLRRSVKYEDIYLKDYRTIPALEIGPSNYFDNVMFPGSAAGVVNPLIGDRSSAQQGSIIYS